MSIRVSNHQGENGNKNHTTMASGGMTPSRLVMGIEEDLGSGLKAIASLDYRFQLDTGASDAGPFWQQSWVGLRSADWGQISLGRDYNVLFDLSYTTFGPYLPVGTFLYGFKPEIAMALGIRNDNMIKYRAAKGPWSLFAQYSAAEKSATTPTTGKSIGAAIRYAADGFQGGLAYLDRTDSSGNHAKAYVSGVAYRKNAIYLNASWSRNNFDDGFNTAIMLIGSGVENAIAGSSPLQSVIHVARRDLITIGGMYELTHQWHIGGQIYFLRQPFHAPGAETGSARFQSALAQYNLSKRTAIYGALEHTSVSKFQLSDSSTGKANGTTSRYAAVIGIKHSF